MNEQTKAIAKMLKTTLKTQFPTVDFRVRQGRSTTDYLLEVTFTAQLPLYTRGQIDEICIHFEIPGMTIVNYQIAA